MDITDIKTFLAAPMAEVSALMDESLKSDIALLDATNRSLLSQGGKMMRPVLSLLAAGACGGIKADSDIMGFPLLFLFFVGHCCSLLLHCESCFIPCTAWPMSCDRGENQRCDTFRSGAKKHFPKRTFVVNVYGKRCQRVWGA